MTRALLHWLDCLFNGFAYATGAIAAFYLWQTVPWEDVGYAAARVLEAIT